MNLRIWLLVSLLSCAGAGWAGTRTVALEGLDALALKPDGEWQAVFAPGWDLPLEPAGAPSLPYRIVSVELPNGASISSITLEGEWRTLGENVTLAPIQSTCAVGETPPAVAPDAALYARVWPEQACENLGVVRSLDQRFAQIKVTPLRYGGGKVEALVNGALKVELDEPAAVRRAFSFSTASSAPARRYVLISPPAFVNEFGAYLALRREQRSDVEFVLKNAGEIYRDYPFAATNSNGVARNPAESIHQFIRENVAANPAGMTYVVLGGTWVDATAITSADDVRLETKMPGIVAQSARLYSHYPLTDLFYACLNVDDGKYPWDGNANGKYADSGELGNNANDYWPDIAVSRIPLRSTRLSEAAVIAAFTEKMRRAEAEDFDGVHQYASAGGELDTTYDAGSGNFLRGEQEFFDGGLNQFDSRRPSSFVDCEVVPRRTLKNILSKRRPVFGGNPLFPNSWGSDYLTQTAAVSGFFSSNRDYTEYRDHGSSTYLYGGFVTVERYLAATGISRLIVAGFSCMTGCIDTDKLTLAEAEIVSSQGGTLASVHNTRFGLSYAGKGAADEDGLSSTLQYRLKLQLMNEDCDLGTAWLKSRQSYCGNAGGQQRFVMMEQMLFGDPLIALSPAVASAAWSGAEDRSQNLGYTSLSVPGGTTIESDKLVKVMQKLTVSGAGDLTFAADGGVGGAIEFAAEGAHKLTLASPGKAYFVQPSNAVEVAIAGSGVTLDLGATMPTFTKLTLDGGETRKTNNFIRGTMSGQLAAMLPLAVRNTEVLFATSDAFINPAEGASIAVDNGAVGFTANPNVGRQYGRWDGFYCPVSLTNSSIVVDVTQTAAFGHSATPGLDIAVYGDSSIATTRGGKINLFGTTAIAVAEGAALTLDAAFAPFTLGDGTVGKIAIANGGTVEVAGGEGLAGEVSVAGGTVYLRELPLKNVTKLTLTGAVKLVVPANASGFYQLLPAKGAAIEMEGATVTVAADTAPDTPIDGAFTSTCAFFDKSAFLSWNVQSGTWNTATDNQPWILNGEAKAYSSDYRAYFPDVAGAAQVEVEVGAELTCDFVNFGNQTSAYVFSGEKLNVTSLQLGTDVTFSNRIYSAAGVLAYGGRNRFSELSAPSLAIEAGATVQADSLSDTITTIKGIRFYPRVMKNSGSVCSLTGLEFYSGDTLLPISGATKSDAPGYSSTNQGYLWDGNTSGAQLAFGSELVWQVTVNSATEFANDLYYLQFDFASPQPLVTKYRLAGGYRTYQNAPTSFRVDVTADGVSWITVSEVSGARPAGNGMNSLWYLDGYYSCSSGTKATAVSVAAGGEFVLSGAPRANFALAEGAVLKAAAGEALQYSANCTFAYPASGRVLIDAGELALAAGAQARVIANSGKVFPFGDLQYFAAADEGYHLAMKSDGLYVVGGAALAGPFDGAFPCGETTWDGAQWLYAAGEGEERVAFERPWSEMTLEACADVAIMTTNDTVVVFDRDVNFGTLKSQVQSIDTGAVVIAGRLRLEKEPNVTVNALVYDLSGFEERVTIAYSTGAARVIAGKDTRLRANGTGTLVVGSGMKAVLYFPAWGGTIKNDGGTVEYRAPIAAPQVEFR